MAGSAGQTGTAAGTAADAAAAAPAAPADAGSSSPSTQPEHHQEQLQQHLLDDSNTNPTTPSLDDARSRIHTHAHSHTRSSYHRHGRSHPHHPRGDSHPQPGPQDSPPADDASDDASEDAPADQHPESSPAEEPTPGASDDDPQQLQTRQAEADAGTSEDSPLVTSVLESVQLVQVVDHLGSPLSTETVHVPPTTFIVDRVSGETVTISAPGSSWTVQASSPGPGRHGSPSKPSLTYNPPVTYSTTTHNPSASTSVEPPPSSNPQPSSSSPSSSSPTSLPSSPTGTAPPGTAPSASLSTSPQHPASSARNSTESATSGNSTLVAQSFGTTETLLKHSSTSTSASTAHPTSSDDESRSSHSTTSDSDYSTFTSTGSALSTWSTGEASTTVGGVGNLGDGTVGDGAPTTTTDSSGESDGGAGPVNLSPQDKQIVGGVVGGVAGAALLLLLVLMAVKYKKRRDQVREIVGEAGAGTTRAIGSAPGGDGGDGGAAAPMSERANPFSVPAAIAGFGARKTQPPADAASGESGFVRVSGRKLPSVLQHGGDGYSDPRESYVSGESDYYRGSQSFEPGSGAATRLALGSPMRPVSGVPVMRSGPGRTAAVTVTDEDPFADPPEPPAPPPRGSLGRNPASNDGSRGSGSRFQEEI